MRGKISFRAVLVLLTALAVAGIAAEPARAAVPVTIVNAGFEDPVYADGDWGNVIPGWDNFNNASGDIGEWNVQVADYPAEAPEGSNVAWIWNAGANTGTSQVLSGATGRLELDASYSMSFYVGYANGYADGGYQVQLLAGGTVLAQDDNTVPLTQGTFSLAGFSYTYDVADGALVGEPLEIRVLSKGLAGGEENEFDDIVMNATYAHPIAYSDPYTVLVDTGSLGLDGSASLPTDGSSISLYEWDLDDDGTYDVTGATPAAIDYATLTGTYGMVLGDNTVKLRVTDGTAQTVVNSTIVTLMQPTTTYIGGNSTKNESWNIEGNWDSGIPTGPIDAIIPAGKYVTVLSASTPTYTGDLTINENATLQIGYIKETHFPQAVNALGTPGSTTIHMYAGTLINNRLPGTLTVPAIELHGDATVRLGSSTKFARVPEFRLRHRRPLFVHDPGKERVSCLSDNGQHVRRADRRSPGRQQLRHPRQRHRLAGVRGCDDSRLPRQRNGLR